MSYFWNILEAISQLAHAVFLGGNPNITFSARCFLERNKNKYWAWGYKTLNKVFFWQEDHCRSSWVEDIVFARKALFELETPRRKPTE